MNTLVEEVEVVSLTAEDRCDRCAARALHVARKDEGDNSLELLFCGHHEKEFGPNMLTNGWRILSDQSNQPESE